MLERHRILVLRLAFLVTVLVLGRSSPTEGRPDGWARPSSGPDASRVGGGALRAVDGDTVLLASGERLRLVAVDCPETGRPGAEEARRLTQSFLDRAGLGPESEARLEPPDPPRDRYGRLLADLRVQGESISGALVEAGLGWVYRSHDPALVQAQARAVGLRRGVHAVLDHPICDGPYLLTAESFHRPGCALVRHRASQLPWAWEAAEPLLAGKAPCRHCLAWPPSPAFGAPRIPGYAKGERALSGS